MQAPISKSYISPLRWDTYVKKSKKGKTMYKEASRFYVSEGMGGKKKKVVKQKRGKVYKKKPRARLSQRERTYAALHKAKGRELRARSARAQKRDARAKGRRKK